MERCAATLTQPEKLSEEEFLLRLKEFYGIKRVYYPACGDDDALDKVFDQAQRVSLDMHSGLQPDKGDLYVKGDYRYAPFRDDSFDALYFVDNHADVEDLEEILRVLRPGGIIVKGWHCGIGTATRQILMNWPGLSLVDLPFTTNSGLDPVSVFQKHYKVQAA